MATPGAKRAKPARYTDDKQGGAVVNRQAPDPFGLDGGDDYQRGPDPYHDHLLTHRIFPKNPFGKDIKPTDINRLLELVPEAYNLNQEYKFVKPLPIRPGFNTTGKQLNVRVNQYKVLDWPQKRIHQYDVNIHLEGGREKETRGLYKAVWNSKKVQQELAKTSKYWIWNGDKIAWSDQLVVRGEVKFQINMDAERGRTPKPGAPPNIVWFHMRSTTKVEMAVIKAYLDGTLDFDNSVLEAINFLDHVMRITPSKKFVQIKRSYFTPNKEIRLLDDTIQAMKGVYASMRLCHNVGNGTGLSVNVDVANGTFWTPLQLNILARNICQQHGNKNREWTRFGQNCRPVMKDGKYTFSDSWKELRKLRGIKFSVHHRGKLSNEKTYTLKGLVWGVNEGKGFDAKSYKFDVYKQGTKHLPNPVVERTISINDYFKERYNITLQYPYLPLVESAKGGMFPMELCKVLDNQRYMFKTDPTQTAAMIKFAVTRPQQRMGAISHGVSQLDWANDPQLTSMGIKISPQMTMTSARLLEPPTIKFASSKVAPGTRGKWDLRGHKFFKPNPEPLKSWGVAIMEECTDIATVHNFVKVLTQQYASHGGNVATKMPPIIRPAGNLQADAVVPMLRDTVGNKFQMHPQILFFVMKERHSAKYERIKKSADCRFGVVSQIVNAAMIEKAQPQYCSNVLMKVNAKLGGTTSVLAGPNVKEPIANFFPHDKAIIIGADVSHPTPNSPQASMAAMTMSVDQNASRYIAAVETNGRGVEMISTENLKDMLMPMLNWWANQNKVMPTHVYYFRDGVSEGQYQQVIQYEVNDIKLLLKEKWGKDIHMTVIVCSKRHRIRMFPETGAGDKNGNPHPGTLVERDVTHPNQYDFYLNSHSAIQGTARPVHYHVLLDDRHVPVDHLQKMIYHQCYTYIRSTTPVSLHPAVYYAHLAASRARSHEAFPSSDGPRGGQKFSELNNAKAAKEANVPHLKGKVWERTEGEEVDVRPLLKMGIDSSCSPALRQKMQFSMWYV